MQQSKRAEPQHARGFSYAAAVFPGGARTGDVVHENGGRWARDERLAPRRLRRSGVSDSATCRLPRRHQAPQRFAPAPWRAHDVAVPGGLTRRARPRRDPRPRAPGSRCRADAAGEREHVPPGGDVDSALSRALGTEASRPILRSTVERSAGACAQQHGPPLGRGAGSRRPGANPGPGERARRRVARSLDKPLGRPDSWRPGDLPR